VYPKRDKESISNDNNPADSSGFKTLSSAPGCSQNAPNHAFLGKDAKTYSVIVNHNTSEGQKRRSQRHRLTGFAQHLLIENDVRSVRTGNRHRTRHCHAARHFWADKIELTLNADENESEASLRGLQTCNSVWACAGCAARLAAARGNEIKRALSWAADNGYIAVMMTMTARHNQAMPLQPFKDAFKRAYKYFREGRAGAALWKSYGIAHTIKGVEVLRNPVNGWHYHQHVLLFVPRASFAGREVDLQTDAQARWLKGLQREGLDGIGEYALTITAHNQTPETYLAKMGISPENTAKLDYELAGGMNKSASKGVNVWTLLQRAQRGDSESAALYLEYVQAMDGEKWIVWSDGFKALVGLDDLSDDEVTDESRRSGPRHHGSTPVRLRPLARGCAGRSAVHRRS